MKIDVSKCVFGIAVDYFESILLFFSLLIDRFFLNFTFISGKFLSTDSNVSG